MDDQYFQWTTIILLSLILLCVLINPGSIMKENQDKSALDFIYRECMNETSINITFMTGQMYLAKENDVCILRGAVK